jgi:hypothetical protein
MLRVQQHASSGTIEICAADTYIFDPCHLEYLQDIAVVNNLSEAPLLDLLRRRYEKDDIYCFVADIVISLNPYKDITDLYSIPKFLESVAKDGVKPHVYTVADAAYTKMLQKSMDQSIIVSGESGAGKTEACKRVMTFLAYLSHTAVSERQCSTEIATDMERKVLECNPFLEAFGNAKTLRNDNSSRFGKFIRIEYQQGRIAGIQLSHYLLEKCRLVKTSPQERNYHIFFQLINGLSRGERTKWYMPLDKKFRMLHGIPTIPGVDDAAEFGVVRNALSVVGVSDAQQAALYQTLSGVLHLGNVDFEEGKDAATFAILDSNLKIATELLGCPDLGYKLVHRKVQSFGRSSMYLVDLSTQEARDLRDALCKTIYDLIFSWIVKTINTSLKSSGEFENVIGILDIFGFEIFQLNSFEQLCINYANEKLQNLFNHHVFVMEQQMYTSEGIDCSHIRFQDNMECVELIEARPQGILPLLDEVCALNQASADESSFLSALDKAHSSKHHYVASRFASLRQFSIRHFAGEVPYSVDKFIEKNKDALLDDIHEMAQQSSSTFMVALFTQIPPPAPPAESTRPTRGNGAKKQQKRSPTIAGQFKTQLASLMLELRQTSAHYIRCIKPNEKKQADYFGAALVLEQLLYNGVLETVRIRHMGFPTRVPFQEFWEYCIEEQYPQTAHVSVELDAVNGISTLLANALPAVGEVRQWQLGNTKVFLRNTSIDNLQLWYHYVHVLPIQKRARGIIIRSRMARFKHAVVFLKRRWTCKLVQRKYGLMIAQCTLLQQFLTRRMAVKKSHRGQMATKLQALQRSRMSRQQVVTLKYAILITAFYRGRASRIRTGRLRNQKQNASTVVSSLLRMTKSRRMYLSSYAAFTKLQGIARGISARNYLRTQILMSVRIVNFSRRTLRNMRREKRFMKCRYIQHVWRGWVARKNLQAHYEKVGYVSKKLLEFWTTRKMQQWVFEAHASASCDDTPDHLCHLLDYARHRTTGGSDYHMLRNIPDLVNVRNRYEGMRTLLHAAARSGEISSVRLVIEFGGKVDVRDSFGATPLHTSVEHGDSHLECSKLLADSCADCVQLLNCRDLNGLSPADFAIRAGSSCTKTLEWIVSAGGGSTQRTKNELTHMLEEKRLDEKKQLEKHVEQETLARAQSTHAMEIDPRYQFLMLQRQAALDKHTAAQPSEQLRAPNSPLPRPPRPREFDSINEEGEWEGSEDEEYDIYGSDQDSEESEAQAPKARKSLAASPHLAALQMPGKTGKSATRQLRKSSSSDPHEQPRKESTVEQLRKMSTRNVSSSSTVEHLRKTSTSQVAARQDSRKTRFVCDVAS